MKSHMKIPSVVTKCLYTDGSNEGYAKDWVQLMFDWQLSPTSSVILTLISFVLCHNNSCDRFIIKELYIFVFVFGG